MTAFEHPVDAGELAEAAAALEAIRAAVRGRQGYAAPEDVPVGGARSPVAEAADLARVSAHLPVTWQTPVIGRGLALAKRATRIALRWYVNPIVEQQNAFNDAVVRALAELESHQHELEHRIEANVRGDPAEPAR